MNVIHVKFSFLLSKLSKFEQQATRNCLTVNYLKNPKYKREIEKKIYYVVKKSVQENSNKRIVNIFFFFFFTYSN